MVYVLMHYARFVRPGWKRVQVSANGDAYYTVRQDHVPGLENYPGWPHHQLLRSCADDFGSPGQQLVQICADFWYPAEVADDCVCNVLFRKC